MEKILIKIPVIIELEIEVQHNMEKKVIKTVMRREQLTFEDPGSIDDSKEKFTKKWKKKHEKKIKNPCRICGIEIDGPGQQRYCSKDCRIKAYQKDDDYMKKVAGGD